MRSGSAVLAFVALLLGAAPARAEWQFKPFAGITFGGGTTLFDPESAVGEANLVVGGNASLLGEIFGAEVDFGFSPGFFDSGDQTLVFKSRVSTLTGNVVVALPRRMAEYGLRPYFVGGVGLMQVNMPANALSVFELTETFTAINLGGGVTGFFSENFGLGWELRHFQTVGGTVPDYPVLGEGTLLSFWRATMALVYRY